MFAGSRHLQLAATAHRPALSAFVHYPCERPAVTTAFGPYELEVSEDAPLAPGRFPLVLISHGSGGSPLLYRTVSLLLARSGYLVGLLQASRRRCIGATSWRAPPQNLRNGRVTWWRSSMRCSPMRTSVRQRQSPVTAIGH